MNLCKHTNSIHLKDSRILSLKQKQNLQSGDIVYLQAHCGHWLRARVNGKPKLWKRQPYKVQVPFKYGLYEYGYIKENTPVRRAR